MKKLLIIIVLAAIAAGANGLFIETHPNPEKALSDAACMMPIEWRNSRPYTMSLISASLNANV